MSTIDDILRPNSSTQQDIGIATFLILLWKQTYGEGGEHHLVESTAEGAESASWKIWPRPPAGFLDLGYT